MTRASLLLWAGTLACVPGLGGGGEDQALNTPPEITNVEVPDWPPIGRRGEIAVDVVDAEGLASVEFEFVETHRFKVYGTEETVYILGSQLGEAVGTLVITARDVGGMRHVVTVHDLLVDLGDPELDVARQVLRADGVGDAGELAVWAGDAWILGEVGVRYGGIELVERFPEGRPATFGEAWDRALITWSATEFPPGRADAEIWVKDAAGNTTSQTFELVVDASPPVVEIEAPLANVELQGPFQVRAVATDPEGEPVWLEVRVGGSFGAEAAGPIAEVWLDTVDFAPGETTIEVTATDRAGNRSPAEMVPVRVLAP